MDYIDRGGGRDGRFYIVREGGIILFQAVDGLYR